MKYFLSEGIGRVGAGGRSVGGTRQTHPRELRLREPRQEAGGADGQRCPRNLGASEDEVFAEQDPGQLGGEVQRENGGEKKRNRHECTQIICMT